MASQSAISMSDIFDISGDLYDLSGSFYSNLANINRSSITTSSLDVSAVEIVGNTLPQMLIKPSGQTGNDAQLIIRGARNASTTGEIAQLRFENDDKDA